MPFDRSLIDKYHAGAEHLTQSIRGLTRDDLLAKPPEEPNLGKWTIQQVVMHLVDCEGVHVDRMKRVISEENPQLMAFDENKWAASLHYAEQNTEEAVKLFDLMRRQMTQTLRYLPDSAFDRAGTHSERGKVTLKDLLTTAITHLDHHLKFIHAKRAAMGKEMW